MRPAAPTAMADAEHVRSDGEGGGLHWATCSCGWTTPAVLSSSRIETEWAIHRLADAGPAAKETP